MNRSIRSILRARCVAGVMLIAIAVSASFGQALATDEESRQRTEYGLAMYAKLLASGVFVVGRDPDEFIRNDLDRSAQGLPDWKQIDVAFDREAKSVTL
jgi:hypothetical protein